MPSTKSLLLLLGVGALLVTNPVWLVPHEGEMQFTYERAAITVENESLTYHGVDRLGAAEENSLNPVECQAFDDGQPRACAFDRYLVNHGPVTTPGNGTASVHPDFVALDGDYYRRIHRVNETGEGRRVVHDVERVSPSTVLADSAVDVTDISDPNAPTMTTRIAATGESVTTFRDLGETNLGNVYRDGDTYYTVVAADETTVDHGLGFLRYEVPRALIALLGVGLVAGAALALRD